MVSFVVKQSRGVVCGKTIEGVVCGVVASFGTFTLFMDRPLFYFIILTITSLFGDLFASFIKRSVGCKNFGTALGSHGGIMDRLDSCIFTIPVVGYISRMCPTKVNALSHLCSPN